MRFAASTASHRFGSTSGFAPPPTRTPRRWRTRGFFSHESPDGTIFWKRVARYYPQRSSGYWSVGENLLWSSPDVAPADALRMWLGSPPHKKNLLTARWREIGLSAIHVSSGPGVFNNAPVTVLTADFGVRR